MNGISGSESNIFIERALTWINASAHGDESVYVCGSRYAVSAFADGEAFLFSSALHHTNCCCDWQLPFGAQPSSVMNRRSLWRSDRVRRPSNSEASLGPSVIFTAWSGTLTVFRRRGREPGVSQARHNLFLDSGMGAVAGPSGNDRVFRLAHDASAARSVCPSAISGSSGVGEKPLSAHASTA